MAHVEHKKVDLVELFFDLVMVYAISQTTGLIHHLHAGVVDPWSLVSFVLAYVILVNAWMYQVVFTNRFGKTSARDIAFSFLSVLVFCACAAPFVRFLFSWGSEGRTRTARSASVRRAGS